MSALKSLSAVALASVFVGCAATATDRGDEGSVDTDGAAVSVVKTGYVTLRRDVRRCAFPMCGGFWVSAAEATRLRCADGSSSTECYVAELDLTKLGVTTEQRDQLQFGLGSAILYGNTAPRSYSGRASGVFLAQKAWLSPSDVKTKGALYFASKNHSKTGRAYQAVRLNYSARRTFDAIDFGAAPGTDAQWDAATSAAGSDEGVILGGAITGPTSHKLFEADQFFLRFPSKPLSCTDALGAQITAVSDGLLWPSESDYPIDFVKASGTVSVSTARALAGADAAAVVEERSFDDWFRHVVTVYDPADPIAVANAERFTALKTALSNNLTGLKVYRFGTIDIRVVIIGVSKCGGVAGIATTVIET
jgi:hypothetical protein